MSETQTSTLELVCAGDISINPIDPSDIPQPTVEFQLQKSAQLNSIPKHEIQQFDRIYKAEDESRDIITIAALDQKTYYTNHDTERLIYVVDHDRAGNIVGNGEVRFNISNPSDYFVNKPFVGWTETEEGSRNEGLNSRRMKIMNKLSEQFFGHTLHSDTLISPYAQKTWQSLIGQGLAKAYQQGSNVRYRFL